MSLPDVKQKPCRECPWRRSAVAGWLGPFTPDVWIDLVRSDEPIACHLTVREETERLEWHAPGIKQCAGAAIFRSNTCKLPRDPEVAALPVDTDEVFGSAEEFVEHHGTKPSLGRKR